MHPCTEVPSAISVHQLCLPATSVLQHNVSLKRSPHCIHCVPPCTLMAHSESAASEEADSSPTNSNTPPGKALVAGRRLRGLSWNKTHQLWRVRIYYAGKLRFVGRCVHLDCAKRSISNDTCPAGNARRPILRQNHSQGSQVQYCLSVVLDAP